MKIYENMLDNIYESERFSSTQRLLYSFKTMMKTTMKTTMMMNLININYISFSLAISLLSRYSNIMAFDKSIYMQEKILLYLVAIQSDMYGMDF